MKKLNLNLAFIRQQKIDLSMQNIDLARKMKVTPQWISLLFQRAENNEGINLATLYKLAKALQCKQKDLLK